MLGDNRVKHRFHDAASPIVNVLCGLVSIGLALGLVACKEAPQDPVAVATLEPSTVTLAHGHAAPVALHWELLPNFPHDLDGLYVFVHLLNAHGDVALTVDHPLPEADASTFVDPMVFFHSALAPALPKGTYQVTVGLYQPGGERFPLRGEDIHRMEYALGEVTIPGTPVPNFEFSETWTPIALGADRQIRAMRWLTGPGSVSYGGSQGGRLLLDLRLPEPVDGKKLLFEEGFDAAQVEVTACDGFQQTLEGFGHYRLEIPVGGPCEITLTPTFYWVDIETFARAALVLEQVGLVGD